MDNLTHTLTGVLLARAGVRRLTPRATWISIAAANIPDIDIVVGPWGIEYLNYHRHLTHSFLAVPFMALLALLIVEGITRIARPGAERLPWFRAWVAATIAAFSHPLLDLTNAYGVRAFLPFSDRWFGWDIFFIVEPWLWAALLVAVVAPAAAGLVDREMGLKSPRGAKAAWAGLLVLLSFGVLKAVLHDRAVETLDAHLYNESPALRVAAFPTALNPWVWSAYVETEAYHQVVEMDLGENFDPGEGTKYFKPAPSPPLEAARNHPLAKDYLRFARYNVTSVSPTPEGHRIEMGDVRFGSAQRSVFRCTFETDDLHRVVRAVFARIPPEPSP